MKIIEKNEASESFNAQLGIILEESASALTQGHLGIGSEGRFKPRP